MGLENFVLNCEKDNEELRKDVNYYKNKASRLEKEIQQKEFIKYLEDEIQKQETVIAENQEKSYFSIYEDEKENLKLSSQKAYTRRRILEEILKKYKKIIEVNDEKES